jgi:mono/diheme cytochrome c family protein
MVPMSEISVEEASAIYAYLKTVPAIRHPMDRWKGDGAELVSRSEGQAIYQKYFCHSCHGNSGAGICDLRRAYQKHKTKEGVIAYIQDASRYLPNSKMPKWHGVIRDEEYGPLADYVRTLGASLSSP